MADTDKPVEEDLRTDDHEYNPAIEPDSAKAWINLLEEAEDTFEEWNHHCDMIDLQFANLERLAKMDRSKEYQIFWANCEVIKPAIYAKAPVPVVVPKFKDRRPVYQAASEVMERCCNVAFDLTGINDLMLLVRDDLAMTNRGVAWCRYESDGPNGEQVAIDFKGRRDFLHSISRNWREVQWVAAASYLTRTEARKRFSKYSQDAYQQAEYRVDKESKNVGGADARERAKFWEIWHKGSKRVVWVAEGVDELLDEDSPHLELQNFFPCPKPAYGTCQRGSLIPVPDVLQYRDQLEEVNLLTGRIHALSDAVEVKGFYPAGGGELSDAIQTAIKIKNPGVVMVPIANWAAFGGTSEVIIWLPIDVIAKVITDLTLLRKQIMDDIYQITGMADIMRGDTDPNETLGAQQLKSQYGTTRIRDRQHELVRLARDLVQITSEIITEKFDDETMILMSQTQLPTEDMARQRIDELIEQVQQQQMQMQQPPPPQLSGPPQGGPPQGGPPQQPMPGQSDPQAAQRMQQQQQMQQAMAEIQTIQQQPTIEQVLYFLKDNRAKAFVLDIETDSTIMVDENTEKQRRSEFVGVLGQLLPQLSQMIQMEPGTANFCGELLKFATAPFRAGRSLDGAIDELVEQVKMKGQQGKGDDPATAQGKIALQVEGMKQQTEMAKLDLDRQYKQAQLAQQDQHKKWELANQREMAQMKEQRSSSEDMQQMAIQQQKMQESREAHQMSLQKAAIDVQMQQQKAALAAKQHALKVNTAQQSNNLKQQALAQKGGGLV